MLTRFFQLTILGAACLIATPAMAFDFLIDFAGTGPNSSGPAVGWDVIENLEIPGVEFGPLTDTAGIDNDVLITAQDDGFNPNNTAAPGTGATYDGIDVPKEARDDYLFKIADVAGTEARMMIENLDPGDYKITLFEGRTSDVAQFGKIWVGDSNGSNEPAEQNTGSFAGTSQTISFTIALGDILWYKHLEDGSGGISGMIIRRQSNNATYDAPFNANANVVADGILSPGEWDAAGGDSSTFGVLREGPDAVDADNNRFRMMWDDTNLYILFQSDYTLGFVETVGGNPNISFGDDNLNFYFDPNTDGGDNVATNAQTAGYQFAFNQYTDVDDGIIISTNDDRQGVGFFTEAHYNSPNGDQANWNMGGNAVAGPALGTIVVAQNNTTSGALAEIVIPWVDFDASQEFDPDVIGLNHIMAPTVGDTWFINVGVITRHPAGSNFLPVWDFHTDGSFTNRNEGHGLLNFVAGNGGVPGDANGDGSFDFGDIEAFFLAITDLPAYTAQYPDVAITLLDMNEDGNTDFGDIEAFFAAVTGG